MDPTTGAGNASSPTVARRRATPVVARNAAGFTYVTVLILVALLGAFGGALAQGWQVATQREREEELLFAGGQIRAAIGAYYTRKGMLRKLPPSLDDLIKDARGVVPFYHLRKLYPDPFSGIVDWELVTAADGGIIGVHSRSARPVLKTSNFEPANASFEGKATYAEWIFSYQLESPAVKRQ